MDSAENGNTLNKPKNCSNLLQLWFSSQSKQLQLRGELKQFSYCTSFFKPKSCYLPFSQYICFLNLHTASSFLQFPRNLFSHTEILLSSFHLSSRGASKAGMYSDTKSLVITNSNNYRFDLLFYNWTFDAQQILINAWFLQQGGKSLIENSCEKLFKACLAFVSPFSFRFSRSNYIFLECIFAILVWNISAMTSMQPDNRSFADALKTASEKWSLQPRAVCYYAIKLLLANLQWFC